MANVLYAYADADWASSDLIKRSSVTGYLTYLNGGVISWASTVQKSVAKSTIILTKVLGRIIDTYDITLLYFYVTFNVVQHEILNIR